MGQQLITYAPCMHVTHPVIRRNIHRLEPTSLRAFHSFCVGLRLSGRRTKSAPHFALFFFTEIFSFLFFLFKDAKCRILTSLISSQPPKVKGTRRAARVGRLDEEINRHISPQFFLFRILI